MYCTTHRLSLVTVFVLLFFPVFAMGGLRKIVDHFLRTPQNHLHHINYCDKLYLPSTTILQSCLSMFWHICCC